VANTAWDRTVYLWEEANLLQPPALLQHTNRIVGLALSPDGQTLATISDQEMTLWNVPARRALAQCPVLGWSVCFSPDGTMAAIGDGADAITLWDVASQSKAATLRGHTRPALALAWSPDGSTLIAGCEDKAVRVWDIGTLQLVTNLLAHSSQVNAVAWSPDGRQVATASADQTVILWEAGTWSKLTTLKGHFNEVWSIAFSPDGKLLVTGSKDQSIRFWSTVPKPEERRAVSLPSGVFAFRLSPNGTSLAAAHTNMVSVYGTQSHQRA
jgi:WD40 repeat protein